MAVTAALLRDAAVRLREIGDDDIADVCDAAAVALSDD
jgi:hypothetical protein